MRVPTRLSRYKKTAPRSRKYDPTNIFALYRCFGADGYRFNGKGSVQQRPRLRQPIN